MDEKCVLIQDLLPLYLEGLCSAESSKIIEAHLAECEECAGVHAAMREDHANGAALLPGEKSIKPFQKIKRHYVKRLVIILVLIALLAYPASLLINDIRGEGVSYSSIAAERRVSRIFEDMAEGEYGLAGEYLYVGVGHSLLHKGPDYYREGMEALKGEGLTLVRAVVSRGALAEQNGMPQGTIQLHVKCDGEDYVLHMHAAVQDYLFLPLGVYPMIVEQVFGPFDDNGAFGLRREDWPRQIIDFETLIHGEEYEALKPPG